MNRISVVAVVTALMITGCGVANDSNTQSSAETGGSDEKAAAAGSSVKMSKDVRYTAAGAFLLTFTPTREEFSGQNDYRLATSPQFAVSMTAPTVLIRPSSATEGTLVRFEPTAAFETARQFDQLEMALLGSGDGSYPAAVASYTLNGTGTQEDVATGALVTVDPSTGKVSDQFEVPYRATPYASQSDIVALAYTTAEDEQALIGVNAKTGKTAWGPIANLSVRAAHEGQLVVSNDLSTNTTECPTFKEVDISTGEVTDLLRAGDRDDRACAAGELGGTVAFGRYLNLTVGDGEGGAWPLVLDMSNDFAKVHSSVASATAQDPLTNLVAWNDENTGEMQAVDAATGNVTRTLGNNFEAMGAFDGYLYIGKGESSEYTQWDPATGEDVAVGLTTYPVAKVGPVTLNSDGSLK